MSREVIWRKRGALGGHLPQLQGADGECKGGANSLGMRSKELGGPLPGRALGFGRGCGVLLQWEEAGISCLAIRDGGERSSWLSSRMIYTRHVKLAAGGPHASFKQGMRPTGHEFDMLDLHRSQLPPNLTPLMRCHIKKPRAEGTNYLDHIPGHHG